MKKTTSIIVLLSGFALAGASDVRAQSALKGKLFVNVSGALQATTDTFTTGNGLTIYGQTATWTTAETVGRGGLFDVSIGYKVRPDIGVALGFSSLKSTGAVAGVAAVPSPIFFNKPTSNSLDTSVARNDRNVYLVVMWFVPIRDNIDVAISGGPSFIRVEQELVNDTVIPTGTSTATPNIVSQSGTAKGVNVGVDAAYWFTKMIGAGLFARYNGGSVDLMQVTGLKAGGFQIGIGGRFRF